MPAGICAVSFFSFFVSARTWYVNSSAVVPEDGSFAHPFRAIFGALGAAAEGDTIRIAAGAYGGTLTMKRRIKMYGGAVFLENCENSRITGSVFESNRAPYGAGGAVGIEDSEVFVCGCTFSANEARQGGGV
ncbi:MAG: hypothetical protein JW881_13185 [Spirochaetales bacterium]|nr:hypothetical protein [Spirochaetales bacterium]